MNKKQIQKVVMQDLETMKVVSLLGTETYVKKQDVIDLIDWLDEKELVELPVLPQFAAEAFEKAKESKSFAEQLLNAMYCNSSDEVGYWLEVPSNEKLLLRAWLDGYTVEKEQLYYVLDKHRKTMLRKNGLGDIYNSSGADVDTLEVSRLSMYQFTEKEIKGFDDRYMAFAVKVEDESNE